MTLETVVRLYYQAMDYYVETNDVRWLKFVGRWGRHISNELAYHDIILEDFELGVSFAFQDVDLGDRDE